ncbi:MAG: hypothetical protein ACXWC7_01360 [Chitinophagaceae bacterium]
MKQLVATLLLIASFSMAIFAQKKEEINFSDPLQVDSSAYFLIPRLVDDVNKDAYGKGKGYLPWGNYSEIFFYNAATKQTKKLFDKQLALIQPFSSRRNYYENLKEPDLPPNILPNHIVYIARTDNFNGDNGLDNEDPQYLYISTKTGDNLRQVTPKGMNVISWTLSKDKKMILVKAQRDKNGNKKFGNGDDELYYRVDLQDDISKIQCEPLNM